MALGVCFQWRGGEPRCVTARSAGGEPGRVCVGGLWDCLAGLAGRPSAAPIWRTSQRRPVAAGPSVPASDRRCSTIALRSEAIWPSGQRGWRSSSYPNSVPHDGQMAKFRRIFEPIISANWAEVHVFNPSLTVRLKILQRRLPVVRQLSYDHERRNMAVPCQHSEFTASRVEAHQIPIPRALQAPARSGPIIKSSAKPFVLIGSCRPKLFPVPHEMPLKSVSMSERHGLATSQIVHQPGIACSPWLSPTCRDARFIHSTIPQRCYYSSTSVVPMVRESVVLGNSSAASCTMSVSPSKQKLVVPPRTR